MYLWCVFVWAQMWRSENILWNLFSPSPLSWLVCWTYTDSIELSLSRGEMVSRDLENSCSNWPWICGSPLAPTSQLWGLVPGITLGAKADLYLDKDFGLCFPGLCVGEHAGLLISMVPDLCDSDSCSRVSSFPFVLLSQEVCRNRERG